MVCTGLGVVGLGAGAGGVVGGARDCEGAGAAAPALGAAAGLWWRWCRCRCTDGVGLGEGEGDGLAEGVAVVFGAVWLPTVAAGAVRANRTAKPTVAIAPSWVARQVSRDRRRSPWDRACPEGS